MRQIIILDLHQIRSRRVKPAGMLNTTPSRGNWKPEGKLILDTTARNVRCKRLLWGPKNQMRAPYVRKPLSPPKFPNPETPKSL